MGRPLTPSLLAAAAVAVGLAGCGGGGGSSASSTPSATTAAPPAGSPAAHAGVGVSTRSISGLGQVIVTAQGQTLYAYVPDKRAKVTCVGECAQVWPPVKLAAGRQASVSGQAKKSLLGSDPDPAGGRVLTYGGWPLYTYISDSVAGQANGQGLESNGGLWYVVAPSGQLVTKTP